MIVSQAYYNCLTHTRAISAVRHNHYRLFSTKQKLFGKVLIANRGEIACRIIKTCRKLKIPTVAVYSSGDGPSAMHAQMADEAVQIGTGPEAVSSYLRMNEIIDVALRTNSEAVHPVGDVFTCSVFVYHVFGCPYVFVL